MSKFQKDMTQGSVAKNLIRFSLPFLAANFLMAMYNLTDMVVVGRFNGPDGASMVGLGGQLAYLVINIISGIAIGGTVVLSRLVGSKTDDPDRMKKTLSTIFALYGVAALGFTAAMFALNPLILKLLTREAPEVYRGALAYINICTAGNIFIFGYNAVSAVLRGMGDSKHPLVFVGISAAGNIVLDIIFVGALKMGASGAALATIIAQAVSLIISITYLKKMKFAFDFRPRSFRIHKEIARGILKVGLPAALQGTLVTLSFMVLTFVADAVAGVAGTTAVSVAGKVNSVAILPAIAMQMSVSSVAGQNFGANKRDRAFKTMLVAMVLTFAISIVAFILTQTIPTQIVSLFVSSNSANLTPLEVQECITQSSLYLKRMSFDYLIVPIVFNISGLAMAAGQTWYSLAMGMFTSLLFRIPAAILLGMVFGMGLGGVAYAVPIAGVGAAVFSVGYLALGIWKKERKSPKEAMALEL